MDPVEAPDAEIVQGEVSAESTERQPSPARRSTPVVVPARARPERSRRSTLVSPIPALMAASMRGSGAGGSGPPPLPEAVPLPAGRANTTARVMDPAKAGRPAEGDGDYVVEIEAAKRDR
jgi:hypothetical protein